MEAKKKTQASGSSFKKQSSLQALSWTGALILLLSSCSAQWHHKQACKKDTAYCATEIRIDTFTVRDTFIYHRVDTTSVIDTITIDTGSVQVKIIREHDIIKTIIKQKPDTTFLTITKQLPPKVIVKYKVPFWVYIICIATSVLLIIRLFR